MHAEAAADRDVAERGGEVSLADPTGPRIATPWAASVNARLVRSENSIRS
jgi:hypothetical protein